MRAPRWPAPGFADECLQRHEDRKGRDLQSVVVEPTRARDRASRVVDGPVESVSEAARPGEPAVDEGLERGASGSVAKRLFEQRDALVIDLDLAEHEQCFCPRPAFSRVGEEIGGDRPGTSPLAVREVQARSSESPAMCVVGT